MTKIDKTLYKSIYQNDSQKMCALMARISYNKDSPRRRFGDSLQLTNWVLDSGATCHVTPEISDFIPGSLVETDKYIEAADGHFSPQNKNRRSSNKNV